jgi:hypothetical protein
MFTITQLANRVKGEFLTSSGGKEADMEFTLQQSERGAHLRRPFALPTGMIEDRQPGGDR